MRGLILILLIGVSGCARSFDQMNPEQRQVFIQDAGERCQQIGYKPGSDDFTNCIHVTVVENDRDKSRRRAAAIASQY